MKITKQEANYIAEALLIGKQLYIGNEENGVIYAVKEGVFGYEPRKKDTSEATTRIKFDSRELFELHLQKIERNKSVSHLIEELGWSNGATPILMEEDVSVEEVDETIVSLQEAKKMLDGIKAGKEFLFRKDEYFEHGLGLAGGNYESFSFKNRKIVKSVRNLDRINRIDETKIIELEENDFLGFIKGRKKNSFIECFLEEC